MDYFGLLTPDHMLFAPAATELGECACLTISVHYGKKTLFTTFKLQKVGNSLEEGGSNKGSPPFIVMNIRYNILFIFTPSAYDGHKHQMGFE